MSEIRIRSTESHAHKVVGCAAFAAVYEIERQLPGVFADHFDEVGEVFRNYFSRRGIEVSRRITIAEKLEMLKSQKTANGPTRPVTDEEAERGLMQILGPQFFQNPPTTK